MMWLAPNAKSAGQRANGALSIRYVQLVNVTILLSAMDVKQENGDKQQIFCAERCFISTVNKSLPSVAAGCCILEGVMGRVGRFGAL